MLFISASSDLCAHSPSLLFVPCAFLALHADWPSGEQAPAARQALAPLVGTVVAFVGSSARDTSWPCNAGEPDLALAY